MANARGTWELVKQTRGLPSGQERGSRADMEGGIVFRDPECDCALYSSQTPLFSSEESLESSGGLCFATYLCMLVLWCGQVFYIFFLLLAPSPIPCRSDSSLALYLPASFAVTSGAMSG
jgi:hypothetical protein